MANEIDLKLREMLLNGADEKLAAADKAAEKEDAAEANEDF